MLTPPRMPCLVSGRAVLWLLCVTAGLLPQCGCSRIFWRKQAEFDAYNILFDKTADSRWDVPRLTLSPDARSRLHDPYDFDRPPLPPDDPAANQYMQLVSGIRGYKSWHQFGQAMSVENPQWLEHFGLKPQIVRDAAWTDQFGTGDPGAKPASVTGDEPVVPAVHRLTLGQAIELANIHSREYQTQIENVFLSALDLTFEQFQFGVRYLGPRGARPSGSLTYFNTPSTRDDVGATLGGGVRQTLPTGGQWAAELANNTLWMFSGPNQTQTSSTLSYSLVQPLFLGAGRKVALENLTRVERRVLYDVRSLARFRKVFFGDVAINGNGGGYYSLLQQLQNISNQEDNVRQQLLQVVRLRQVNSAPRARLVTRLEALPPDLDIPENLKQRLAFNPASKNLEWDPAPMSDDEFARVVALSDDFRWRDAIRDLFEQQRKDVITLDMAQLLTNLVRQQNAIRTNQQRFADNVDRFKQGLGLPPDLQLTIDRSFLRPFELYDPRIQEIEQRVLNGAALLEELDPDVPAWDVIANVVDELTRYTNELDEFAKESVAADLDRVEENLPQRQAEVETEADRARLAASLKRDRQSFNATLTVIKAIRNGLADVRRLGEAEAHEREDWNRATRTLRRAREAILNELVQPLRSVQALQRAELITLRPFAGSLDEVVAQALSNRLDLMNSRAVVMDARRSVEVAANRLRAGVNVVVDGDLNTSLKDRPLDFRGNRSTYRAGLQFQAPVDQIAERNAYRAALVAFQRSKRTYMQLEDQVKFEVRSAWRQMTVQRKNLETSRQNLRFALIQADSAIERANAPTANNQAAAGVSGNNLLQALNNVLNAQNDLISIWVNYEQSRINIHRDMDTMVIDERGLWVDPAYQTSQPGLPIPQNGTTDVLPVPPAGTGLDVEFDDLALFDLNTARPLTIDDVLARPVGAWGLHDPDSPGDRNGDRVRPASLVDDDDSGWWTGDRNR